MRVLVSSDGIIGMLASIVLSEYFDEVYLVKNKSNKHTQNINRYFSINLLSKFFFTSKNLWDCITCDGITEYSQITTLDEPSKKYMKFQSSSIAFDCMGYIVNEKNIIDNTRKKIETIENIFQIDEVNIDNHSKKSLSISLDDMKLLNIDYIFLSDNSRQDIANLFSNTKQTIDYKQDAIVVNLTMNAKNNNMIAYQRFDKNNIQGLLPVSDNMYNLIWSAKKEIINELHRMSDSQLLCKVNDTLSVMIGEAKSTSSIARFPLKGYHYKSYRYENIFCIGGAAHSVHPMAGLGLNMGIKDVFLLEYFLSSSSKNKGSINRLLETFSNRCRIENSKYFYTINLLKTFYSDDHLPNFIRSASMKIFDSNIFFKRKIIETATGIDTLKKYLKDQYCYTNH